MSQRAIALRLETQSIPIEYEAGKRSKHWRSETNMSELNIQLCPETGICSIIRESGAKVDLMPDEVAQLRDSGGAADKVRAVLGEVDAGFAQLLDADELGQVACKLS